MGTHRNVAAVMLLGATLLARVDVAAAADDANLLCRQGIESGLRRWAGRTIALRQQCLSRSVLGQQSINTDCTGADETSQLARKLSLVDEHLARLIARRCSDADFTILSYPGPCPDDSGGFEAQDLLRCVREVGGAAINAMLAARYPVLDDYLRGASAECVNGVALHSQLMLSRDLRARLLCELDKQEGELDASVDCLALPRPFGGGTHSDIVDERIERAHLAWVMGFPPSCSRFDLDTLAYSGSCDTDGDGALVPLELQSCVFRSNIQQTFALMDIVFPSDPVCGNGILQEGEICDDGLANSDTAPNACRTDCVLPACGDAVTDPSRGETCDDGDLSAGDGCNAACQDEFCGDAIVNDNPAEQCDDGNAVSTDRCTGTCRNAVCGDGFECTAAACTSGPGGGAEQCDDGVANASNAACKPDCSGFRYTCDVTVGISSNENLGGVTYEIEYKDAAGEFLDTGGTVKCTSLVPGGLFSFFDNETKRSVRESVILASGFQAPLALARCEFASNDAGLAGSAFTLKLVDASNPDFEPRTPVLAVTSVDCM